MVIKFGCTHNIRDHMVLKCDNMVDTGDNIVVKYGNTINIRASSVIK